MRIPIAKDGWAFIFLTPLLFVGVGGIFYLLDYQSLHKCALVLAVIFGLFMVYFFRDPERVSTAEPDQIVSGADGVVRSVEKVREERFINGEAIRLSVFLNPFNVHVNRAPIGGVVKGLDYTPGKRLLTMQNAASEYNEHSSIYIEGENVNCLVKQIVGPVVRRVVYWLKDDQELKRGDRIGIMKFGSRMDIYFPHAAVEIIVKEGDKVKAGETIVAHLK